MAKMTTKKPAPKKAAPKTATKKVAAFKNGGSVETSRTTRMPSGAQQYVRGKAATDRMDTLIRMGKSKAVRGNHDANMAITDAFLDETKQSGENYEARKRARASAPGKPLNRRGK